MDLDLNGSTATYTNVNTGSAHGTFAHLTNNTTLGVNKFKVKNKANNRLSFAHFEVATPIHTSSHYQSFETPFLHELVGGDRNMEQTNLVCSPDGKTWDQVTRDTSYIGASIHNPNTDNDSSSASSVVIFTEHRGTQNGKNYHSKNFATAYDRQICLVNGIYRITHNTIRNSATAVHGAIYVNGVEVIRGHSGSSNHDTITTTVTMYLKRGDYVQIKGYRLANDLYSSFEIVSLDK